VRDRPAENRRTVRVGITATGLALVAELTEPLRDCHARQLGHMTAADLQQLVALLHAARRRMRTKPALGGDSQIAQSSVDTSSRNSHASTHHQRFGRRRRRHRRRPGRLDRIDVLAQQGLRVQLFEREKFRVSTSASRSFRTYWVLERLGMLDKMKKSHFVKKFSVQFVNAAASCRRRSISGTTSRTNVRRPGKWSAANSTR